MRFSKTIIDIDLFCSSTSLVGGGVSKVVRPLLPLSLMMLLLYLKRAFNECNMGVVECWAETLTLQYHSRLEYSEHRWSFDLMVISKFRRLLVEEGINELLDQTINVAVNFKLISKKDQA